MASTGAERNHPILLQSSDPLGAEPEPRLRPRSDPARTGFWALSIASAISAFWIGITAAYIWGYYGPARLSALPVPQLALMVLAALLPPFAIIASAWALARGAQMSAAAAALAVATESLFTVDEATARTAARLGRAVRRELDALNVGLDGAFARLRALESVLEHQIAAVDEAGARLDVRGEAVASRLMQERERIEGVASALADAASRASETVAGRSAQLKSTIESAESSLRSAGQSLDSHAASFRQAAQQAAEAPKNAVVELDAQAKRIESVADAAMARAEFVLGRHERHRATLTELVDRLKQETSGFEAALSAQRAAIEKAVGGLSNEASRFEIVTGEADRKLDIIMANASARATLLAQSYGREVERLKESTDAANDALTKITDTLREAGTHAEALIANTTGQAKTNARALVGEAMAECERLLRAAGEMSIEAGAIRQTLSGAVEDIERHLLAMPSIAQQEAQRVRELVRNETEQMLDLSARTLSTIKARSSTSAPARPSMPPSSAQQQEMREEDGGLRGLAKKLTRPKKKGESSDLRRRDEKSSWAMSELLAAANADPHAKELKPSGAAALGAMEALMADLAIDLDALAADVDPSDEAWQRYLQGDRTVFARRLASTIDETSVDKIAGLYRDDPKFRDAADTYLSEYEGLLMRATEGDSGGLLASTMLSSDTGKIYLAIAYALGRL